MSGGGALPPAPPSGGSDRKVLWIILGLVACVLVIPAIGIVGMLAAIAIPNFLKFQCKSKQSEAKTNLSGLFTAEKAFYGEYGFYTSDLVAVNWQPDGSPWYVYGFAQPGPGMRKNEIAKAGLTDYDERRSDTTNTAVVAKGGYSTMKMKDLAGRPLAASDLPAEATVQRDSFIAGAVGDIDTDATPQYDVWTIDDTKRLTVVDNDCTH